MERYKNPLLSVEERVEDLLGRMTIEEKIGQVKSNEALMKLYVRSDEVVDLSEEAKESLKGSGIGFTIFFARFDEHADADVDKALTPQMCAEFVNKMQEYNLENTRLGIPILNGNPATHGHMSVGSTMFPVGLMTGSTWNTELFTQVASTIAIESRAQGSYMSDTAIIDLVLDPRWGRTEENYGEDPYLVSEMACAAVRGMQNNNEFGPDSVVAMLKHFIGHGAPTGGRNCHPCALGGREFVRNYLAIWKKVVLTGALGLMPSYNEVDGIQNHRNKEFLTDLVKTAWGFKGYIISDQDGIQMMHTVNKVAKTIEDAEITAFNAGVDVDIALYPFKHLKEAYEKGLILDERLDEAVSRILYVKFKLGLFENPFVDLSKIGLVGCKSHRELACEVARQGIILLENKDQILPLKKDMKTIAIVGPNADNLFSQIGDYSTIQRYEDVTTVFKGIRDYVKDTAIKILYAKGCSTHSHSDKSIKEAVETAKESDIVIAVMGGSSWKDGLIGDESNTDCGEFIDKANLDLTESQLLLLKKLKDTGKKLIVILVHGRPQSVNWVSENCDALLEAWYPGCEGGRALAEIIFGSCIPSGKLSVSVPRHSGQLPIYYHQKSQRTYDYHDLAGSPLYPFGYGLSYSKFSYLKISLKQNAIKVNGSTDVVVQIENSGQYDAVEVVQLYIFQEFSVFTRPKMELKGFQRKRIDSGKIVNVVFSIGPEELRTIDSKMNEIVEPGSYRIMVGRNSVDFLEARLEVIG